MDIRILRYFLAVAREENITKAAKSLHISQPSLSVQLMELEQEIGKKLLIRGKRKVTLTDEGVLLRKRAEEILSLVEKTERELTADDEIINGDIAIGSGESEAMNLIMQAAASLSKEYPDVHYHLYSGDADEIMERLDKGLLDFGILIDPVNQEKYDSISLKVSDTWGILMKRKDPLAGKPCITQEDIKALPLIVPKRKGIQKQLLNWLNSSMADLHIVADYNVIYHAALMVKNNFGYAIALDKLIDTEEGGDLCFKPFSPQISADMCLVWKRYQVFSKPAEKFIEQLRPMLR